MEKGGIWEDLRAICPYDTLTHFSLEQFDRRDLTPLDSTPMLEAVRELYPLVSVFPIQLMEVDSNWNSLAFLGTQYDSDQLTEFLGLAILSKDLSPGGSLEFISGEGEWAGEWTFYHTRFLAPDTYELDRIEGLDCDLLGEGELTGEIEKMHFVETYHIRNGRIQKQRSDTLLLQYCE